MNHFFWNIYYDDVLGLPMPERATISAFADGLTLTLCADDEKTLKHAVDLSLGIIEKWLEERKLNLTPEKTDSVVLKGPTKIDQLPFMAKETEIMPGSLLEDTSSTWSTP